VYSVRAEFIILSPPSSSPTTLHCPRPANFPRAVFVFAALLLAACTDAPWNSPYPGADPNLGFALTYGDTFGNLGVVISATQAHSFYRQDEEQQYYVIGGGDELQLTTDYDMSTDDEGTRLGLVGNFNYRLGQNHKLELRTIFSRDSSSQNRFFAGYDNDIANDAREVEWNDVTSSAYAEQDRINVDLDELVGNFSGSSIQTNRQLNETVGGMKMLNQSASMITEYLLTTFRETWVEPVLTKLLKLEQYYESDEVILALAQKKARLMARFGISDVMYITRKTLREEPTWAHRAVCRTLPDGRWKVTLRVST